MLWGSTQVAFAGLDSGPWADDRFFGNALDVELSPRFGEVKHACV